MNPKLRIAVQNKGRLMQPSLDFLKEIGLKFELREQLLVMPCVNADIEILFVRCGDIPAYVEQNVADFAIIGENVLYEKQSDLEILERLSFGICSLVIAVPNDSNLTNVKELEGERIATSYPFSLKKFLGKKAINAAIIEIKGSVEIAPTLDLADAVCDITQTGRTLNENGLRIIDKVLDSQACLICSPQISNQKRLYEEILSEKIRR